MFVNAKPKEKQWVINQPLQSFSSLSPFLHPARQWAALPTCLLLYRYDSSFPIWRKPLCQQTNSNWEATLHLGSLSFQHPAFSTSCILRRCSQPCSRYRGARTPLRCLQLHVWTSASFAESWVLTHFFHSLLNYMFLNQLWLPPFSLLVYAFILAQLQQKRKSKSLTLFPLTYSWPQIFLSCPLLC